MNRPSARTATLPASRAGADRLCHAITPWNADKGRGAAIRAAQKQESRRIDGGAVCPPVCLPQTFNLCTLRETDSRATTVRRSVGGLSAVDSASQIRAVSCLASLTAFLLAAGAIAAGATPPAAGGPETLERSDGAVISGHLAGLKGGSISFIAGAGEQQIPLAALSRLVRMPFHPTARPLDGVVLSNGDLLEGQALELAGSKLKFQSGRFGTLEIDSRLIRGLFFDRPLDSLAGAVPAKPKAEVLLDSGSRTSAELRWLDSQKVGLSTPLGPVEVNRSDVSWVFLANSPTAPPPGACRVKLTTGECLTGVMEGIADGRVKLTVSLGGGTQTLAMAWDVVRSVESAEEHLAYLSAIAPASQTNEYLIGPARSMQPDACAAGGPLRLDGRIYDRGIGMRAQSQAAWALNGAWQRFRARVGLDEQAAGASRGAVFRVLADGRRVFEKQLAPGDKAVDVDVPVGGVKDLTLILDAGPGFDLGDYGDWADARLLR